MYSLNIQNSTVCFKDIKLEHLPQILKWYNKVDDFKFATGIDKPISIEALTRKYAEVTICTREFYVGVFLVNNAKMIGIIKGRLLDKNNNSVWINSIVIDPDYQRQGYGSEAVSLLLDYLKFNLNTKNVFLAVVENNFQGRAFWKKLSFKNLRIIENHLRLQNNQYSVIVMSKHL